MSGRVWTSLIWIAVIAVAVVGALQLRIEFDVHRVLNPSESELAKVQKQHADLPWKHNDFYLVISFDREIGRAQLEQVERVAGDLEKRADIDTITSLGRVPVVTADGALPRLFQSTLEAGQSVRDAAWSHPLLRGTLISQDGRSTVLAVRAERLAIGGYPPDLISTLPGAVRSGVPSAENVRIVGSSVVLRGLRIKMERGIAVVLGLEVLLFLILLPFLFRTVRGSVLPIAVVLVAVLANFGWMGFFGFPLTIIDVAIPGLVVIIGLCDTIHLLQRFEESYAETLDAKAASQDMIASVGKACFYTSFTTCVGFLSLMLTDHQAVSSFGLKAAVSVLVTFVVVVTLVPCLLRLLRLGPPRALERVRMASLGYGRPRLVLALALGGVLFTTLGIARVSVDSFLLEEIPASDPIAVDCAWFEENFSGILDVETRVRGELRDPDVFAALEAFEKRMLQERGLTRVDSITLYAREALANPEGRLDEKQLERAFGRLRLARAALPTHLVDEDFELARVVFKSRDVGLRRMTEYRDLIRERAENLAPALEIECAGYVLMANNSTELIVRAMTQSLLLSVLVISVFLAFLFRSIILAVISLCTNLLPLAFALGLSGWCGIHFTIGSAIIYCLGLGLAVDDTIHLLTRYQLEKELDPRAGTREHLLRTLRSSGKALITTSIVLAVGTLCHLAAEFRTLHNVGILLTAIVIMAVIVDLWLLPLLVERFIPDEEASS